MIGMFAALALAAQPLPPPPPPITIEQLRAAFTTQSGGDTIYFNGDGFGLDAAAEAALIRQARWLRANPAIPIRVEGHSGDRATRDHALAIGERRAAAVRDFLILQGVPAAQISIISWGKERPVQNGASAFAFDRAVTVLMPPGML